MNLKGVGDTTKHESYFWKVCGSSTLGIVILTLIFGFRRRLHNLVWTERAYSRVS